MIRPIIEEDRPRDHAKIASTPVFFYRAAVDPGQQAEWAAT